MMKKGFVRIKRLNGTNAFHAYVLAWGFKRKDFVSCVVNRRPIDQLNQ